MVGLECIIESLGFQQIKPFPLILLENIEGEMFVRGPQLILRNKWDEVLALGAWSCCDLAFRNDRMFGEVRGEKSVQPRKG